MSNWKIEYDDNYGNGESQAWDVTNAEKFFRAYDAGHADWLLSVLNDWPTVNKRRGELIDKEIGGTLTDTESTELAGLQLYADQYLDVVAPRPDLPPDLEKFAPEKGSAEPATPSNVLNLGTLDDESQFLDFLTGLMQNPAHAATAETVLARFLGQTVEEYRAAQSKVDGMRKAIEED